MFGNIKKNLMVPFYRKGLPGSRLRRHYRKMVNFNHHFHEFLTLVSSNLKGQKNELI